MIITLSLFIILKYRQMNAEPKKYKYYFFDYIYYCGENRRRKTDTARKPSGEMVITLYWFFYILLPLSIYIRDYGWLPDMEVEYILVICISVIFGLPLLFCFLRYHKERVSAIYEHFYDSKLEKMLPPMLVCVAPVATLILYLLIIKC